MTRWLTGLWRIPAATYRSLARHDVFVLAGAIAYSALLSFFPLVIATIALLSQFVDEKTAQQAVVGVLTPYLPPGVPQVVQNTLEGAIRERATAGALATLALLWTATAVASTLRHSLNRLLEAPAVRPFLRRKAVELAMVAMGGALIVLSVAANAALTVVGELPALAGIMGAVRTSAAWNALASAGPWILSGTAFLVVYRFLPNVRLRRRSLLAGCVIATALFQLSTHAFLWYLRTLAHYPLAYGPLAGVVILMVWVYLGALVTLVCAALMRQAEDFMIRQKEPVLPQGAGA